MTSEPDSARPTPALIADLGATNARFALADPDRGVYDLRILPGVDYPGLAEAIRAYLDEIKPPQPPRGAAIAIASPVVGDTVSMTNLPWTFSISGLKRDLGLDRLEIINDFTAVALAVPHLGEDERVQIGGGTSQPGWPIGVLGPGTGLGVSGLVPSGRNWTALAGEGGHVTMPATNDREAAVLQYLRRHHDHVSAERVLSGMGLTNLCDALAMIDGRAALGREPKDITEAALAGGDPTCTETVAMFCAMLGTVAGNLALTLGARGGVYVAGGIVPRLGDMFDRSEFRVRFEAKGRFRDYLSAIPTYLVTHTAPAFLGLKAAVEKVED